MASLGNIRQWCETGELPEPQQFFEEFTDGNAFIPNEGLLWDFKDKWPFSYTDGFFGGIARLVCAFSNTLGGVIIFGVDDKKRTGGHNKTFINVDKMCQAIEQLTGERPTINVKTYQSVLHGDVTALLIAQRPIKSRPYRFLKKIEQYPSGVVWVRSGHEVVQAHPQHYPVLFCRAGYDLQEQDRQTKLSGSLPPNPNTLAKFIGRSESLDLLFQWLISSDEPRKYLYGKGGSGKTAIAYEFAKLLENYGQSIEIDGGKKIDNVIFVSAKEKKLDAINARIESIVDVDFSSEDELYRSILVYGGWITWEIANSLSVNDLRTNIDDFFNISTCVLIVDDIDTLTTKGKDAGTDFIYRVLSRCRTGSKVLYTVRNAPSQSLANSIEVPGLSLDGEYQEFVKSCVTQFGVQVPSDEFRDGQLAEISERRPLVVESILALRRKTNNYSRAVELFREHTGADIRDYVFLREWDALASNTLSKQLLVALAEIDRPSYFKDIEVVLGTEPSRLLDAIGEVREMFLQIGSSKEETIYSLAPLTRKFVLEKRNGVDRYAVIKERVRSYRRYSQVATPETALIKLRVDRLVSKMEGHDSQKLQEAWSVVTEHGLPAVVTENPIFRCIRAFVATKMVPPKLTEAREDFRYSNHMGHEPEIDYLKSWLAAEKSVDEYSSVVEEISNIVLNGRNYSQKDKIYMRQQNAKFCFFRAKYRSFTEPIDARKDYLISLIMQLELYKINIDEGHYWVDDTYDHCMKSAYALFDLTLRDYEPAQLLDTLKDIFSLKGVYFDPLERPLRNSIREILQKANRPDQLNKIKNKAKVFDVQLVNIGDWADRAVKARVIDVLRALDEGVNNKLKVK